MLHGFPGRTKTQTIDHTEQLISEFWKAVNELELIETSYDHANTDYIECGIWAINEKRAKRDVLLKQIRQQKNVEWMKREPILRSNLFCQVNK